ncbi:MAG: hypothetical protein QM778_27830 [Myxococcales bacterium]
MTSFDVYLDYSAIVPAGTPCASALLHAGEPVPASAEALHRITTKASTQSLGVQDIGIREGEKIPVTVVTRDVAGNPSVASEVVCVERLAATGKGKSKREDSFDDCVVHPGRPEGALGVWALAFVLFASWRGWRRLGLRKSS